MPVRAAAGCLCVLALLLLPARAWSQSDEALPEPLTQRLIVKFRALPAAGVAIVRVERNSPASKAGLRAATRQRTVAGQTMLLGGDVIVAVNGTPVGDAAQLGNAIGQRKPGDKVTLQVVRDRAKRTVDVTLGVAPA